MGYRIVARHRLRVRQCSGRSEETSVVVAVAAADYYVAAGTWDSSGIVGCQMRLACLAGTESRAAVETGARG